MVQSIPLQEHIKKYLDVKKSGHNAIAKCPFHTDSSPSLYIYPNNYHCFACNAHGNIIDFEINHKNISFREAVVGLAAQYQIDIVLENERKQTAHEAKQAKLVSHAEELHKILKDNFAHTESSSTKNFLEKYFPESGFLDSVDFLRERGLATPIPGSSFYVFPFQTERSEIFGFLFTQLDFEINLCIPITKKKFTIILVDRPSQIIHFPQARRYIVDKSLIVATSIFDFFFLLKQGVKNTVLIFEETLNEQLYSYLSKYVSKIFLILSENTKNTKYVSEHVTIFVRWTQKEIAERIEFYKTLNEHNIFQWLYHAQKFKSDRSVQLPPQNLTSKLIDATKQNTDLFRKVSDFYHRILLHPSSLHVVEYLKSRGLTIDDIKEWKLGFCPRDSVLMRSLLKQHKDLSIFIELGILRISQKTKRYYDFFYDRFIIPIMNHSGQYVALGGRILQQDLQKNPKYINSAESPLFSKSKILFNFFSAADAIVEKGYVIVVEGFLDCITLVKYGVKNTVAVMGSALTVDHLASLSHITQRVILCFDADLAGQQALKKSFLANFKFPELILETIQLPLEKDPDAFVKIHGVQAFLAIVQDDAHPVYQYVVQWFQEQSQDFDEFVCNLKYEYRYCEFPSQSVLGMQFKEFLSDKYNIDTHNIFAKNSLAIESTDTQISDTALEILPNAKCIAPIWGIKNSLEIKILFAFFYSQFCDLPAKLKNVLIQSTNTQQSSKSDLFYETYENQISEVGKQIFQQLYSYCLKKGYLSCLELNEEDVSKFPEYVKIFVAYLKKSVSILVAVGLEFLLDFQSGKHIKTAFFDSDQVWSAKNRSFLRLQQKNAELAYKYGRLVHVLIESLAQLEIAEIDSQLKSYSKTHFDHEIKEKFADLMIARAARQFLLMSD